MSRLLILLLALAAPALAGPPTLPQRVPVFEFELKRAVLERAAQGRRFLLPRFTVYDRSGNALFFVQGPEQSDLVPRLEAALVAGRRLNVTPLDAAIGDLIDSNGQTPRRSLLPAADYVLFQYHADWCETCPAQAAELARWAAGLSNQRVVWLSVRADPTRLSPWDR